MQWHFFCAFIKIFVAFCFLMWAILHRASTDIGYYEHWSETIRRACTWYDYTAEINNWSSPVQVIRCRGAMSDTQPLLESSSDAQQGTAGNRRKSNQHRRYETRVLSHNRISITLIHSVTCRKWWRIFSSDSDGHECKRLNQDSADETPVSVFGLVS